MPRRTAGNIPPDMGGNLLLGVLRESERLRLKPYCRRVALPARATLCEADEPLPYAWFIESGVCSVLAHARNGDVVEVGLIGREGLVGIPLVLGETCNPFHVIVQMSGGAIRIPRDACSGMRTCTWRR